MKKQIIKSLMFLFILSAIISCTNSTTHHHDGRYLNLDDNIKLFSVVDRYNELLTYTISLEKRLKKIESTLFLENRNIISPPKKIE